MNDKIGEIYNSNNEALLRLWRVRVQPGYRPLRQHSHIRFEISLIEQGEGTYTVGDKTYPMRPGDMFVFSSNEQHCITAVGEQGLGITNMQFEPRYLWGYATDSLSEDSINLCFAHSKAFQNRIPAGENGALRRLFETIVAEFVGKAPEYALIVKSLLNLLLVRLIRDFGYADISTSMSRGRLHSIRRVIRHIDEHLCEDLSLAVLADIAGMSPNYFSALFHDVSGITLWDYINSKRIERAKQLLGEHANRNILEIAAACGFNNTANFNKTFKAVTGITPSEYRRSDDILLQ